MYEQRQDETEEPHDGAVARTATSSATSFFFSLDVDVVVAGSQTAML
jgi:hypothetical protein